MSSSAAYDDREGFIWLDGEFVEWRTARVPIVSEGLIHGITVFEGEKVYAGRIFLSKRHSQRLKQSASMLGFELPYSIQDLELAKQELIERNGAETGYVRSVAWAETPFVAWAEDSSRPKGTTAGSVRVAAAVWYWGDYYATKASGVRLTLASWRRPHPNTAPFQAKASGLYMICTLAKHDAEAKGFGDALMLDWRGYVAEATSSNVFFARDGVLHTPTPDCFLNGFTRQMVLALAQRRGIQVNERTIMPEEIGTFDECFLTGSAAELSRVSSVDLHNFSSSAILDVLSNDYKDLTSGKLSL